MESLEKHPLEHGVVAEDRAAPFVVVIAEVIGTAVAPPAARDAVITDDRSASTGLRSRVAHTVPDST